jgi:hypothetical protein
MGCGSCDDEVKPAQAGGPSMLRKLANFTYAVARYFVAGRPNVPEAEFHARLEMCHGCSMLLPDLSCSMCGCPVEDKALWATEVCPAGKWAPLGTKAAPEQCEHVMEAKAEFSKDGEDFTMVVSAVCARCGCTLSFKSLGMDGDTFRVKATGFAVTR